MTDQTSGTLPPMRPVARAAPDRVGPYDLGRAVGAGAMGTVYEARDRNTGALVAVKLMRGLPPDDAQRRSAIARFKREASIHIDHPNVVRRIASELDGEHPYLALELLEGETLAERLTSGPLDVATASKIVAAACRGLHAVHAAGVVHRDVKPSNIFVGHGGPHTTKIIDFGVAALRTTATRLTATNAKLGTPAYWAPEQLRGSAVDSRADIWAMGVVLYETLTGRHPYIPEEGDLHHVYYAIQHERLVPVRNANDAVPARIAAIIDRALSRDIELRWSSAAELAAVLEDLDRDANAPELEPSQDVSMIVAEDVRYPRLLESMIRAFGGRALRLATVADASDARWVGLFERHGDGDDAHVANAAALLAEAARRVVVVNGKSADAPDALSPELSRSATEALAAFGEDGAFAAAGFGEAGRALHLDARRRVELAAQHARDPLWIVVEGPVGSGKTAHALAALDAASARGAISVSTRALPGHAAAPWLTFQSLARALVDEATARDPRAGTILSRIFGSAHRARASLGDDALDDRTFVRIRDLFRAVAETIGPLAILVDDAHWADATSIAHLARIIRELPSRGSVAIATVDEAGAAAFRRALEGQEPLAVRTERGDAASAFDALAPARAEALLLAARFGIPVGVATLGAMGVEDPAAEVDALVRDGLLRRASERDATYVVARGRDAATAFERPLAPAQCAAMAAELRSAEGPSAYLVDHLLLAGDARRAGAILSKLASRAAQRGESSRVLELSERLFALDPAAVTVDLRLHRARAHVYAARWAVAEAELERVLSDPDVGLSKRAVARAERAFLLQQRGDLEAALDECDRAMADADLASDSDEAIVIVRCVATLLRGQRLDEARAMCERALRRTQSLPGERARVLGTLGQVVATAGDISARFEAFRETIATLRTSNDLRQLAGTQVNFADAYNRVGLYREAERQLRDAIDGCRTFGHRVMESYGLLNLGYALWRLGRIDDALRAFDRLDRSVGPIVAMTDDLYRARALMATARFTTAADLATRAIEAGRSAHLELHVILGHAARARARLQQGDVAGADEDSREAITGLDVAGIIEEDQAYVYVVRAQVLEALEDRDGARSVYERGRRFVIEAASTIAGETERTAFEQDIPEHRLLLGPFERLSAYRSELEGAKDP